MFDAASKYHRPRRWREVASRGLSSHARAKWSLTTTDLVIVAFVPSYALVALTAIAYHLCTA